MSVARALSELETAGLIDLVSTRPEVAYLIRHGLVGEAAYDSLLKGERRDLHLAVGEAIERLFPEQVGELAGELALHFEQGGDRERALAHLLVAGRHALHLANREARGFLERAKRLLPAGDAAATRRLRAEIELGAARAGYSFIPHDQVLAALEALMADVEASGDERLLAEAHLWIARVRYSQGERYMTSERLRRSIDRAREIGARLGDQSLTAIPDALIGKSRVHAAEFRAGAAILRETIPVLERLGSLTEASLTAGVLAVALARLGEFDDAGRWARRAIQLAEESGDPNTRLDADLTLGQVEAERGNTAEALALARSATAAAEAAGNTMCVVVGSYFLGQQQLQMGAAAEAVEALEKSEELATFCDMGVIANLSAAYLSAARCQTGDRATALSGFDRALRKARKMRDPLGEGEIHRQRALATCGGSAEERDAAWADFVAAEAIFERVEARPYLARTLRDHGEALLEAGRAGEARPYLRRSLELFDAMSIADEADRVRTGLAAVG